MLFRTPAINQSLLSKTVSVLVLAMSLAACGGENNTATNDASPNTATDATASSPGKLDLGGTVRLTGAGASFPAPLYQTWFQNLNKKYPSLQVSYQSVGSGAGVEQFTKGTVDFGASDVAMKDDEIQKVPQDKGVLLLPMTAGTIVLAYNLPGVEQLNLPRAVYTDILLGKIKTWNDPKIAAANSGVNLPNEPITVVYRSDGSGTTGVFTKHMSTISPEWKSKVGEGKTVSWPVGVGAKGNEGVTAQVQQTQGSIGYIEYGYAKQNNLKFAALENKAGKFVTPNDESASKTLEAITLPTNMRAFEPDPQGDASYPIISYSWILAYKKYPDAAKAKAVEAMIEYGLTEGQKVAPELGYVALPQNVIEKVAAAADAISPDYKIAVGSSNSPSANK
ncbi:phosphate ABC transporter substrate-binding protein PstS [Chlorogloeopsis sp. ULAP01]|uniref:phosphate ABC transporter substrate-binding protein PstS n=1 Tax=Chlorogloeopsis sp. ULAP01 TaxID=3056483 RepID=UPI0025AA50D4|nr:phosphate ABC transporter substrate-binding protein PstS [Chlorogloeopsis sp. ULAP01]MDM9384315.1 phosphate ABC transporter substrate-binding protein PstS [Chlorogloeopsis sp. ULAP01]